MTGSPPRARRALLVLMTAAFTVVVIELLSAVVLGVVDRRVPSWSRLAEDRAAVAAGASPAPAAAVAGPEIDEVHRWMLRLDQREVIHPYLGFVEHRADGAVVRDDLDPEAARFGFPRNTSRLFWEPDPHRLVVAVVGGSFSRQIGFGGRRLLEQGLAEVDRFRGREIVVLALGLGGYKQPQQLMTVGYFLSLGMHIDVLVNIDGFNEVVLPLTENLEVGLNPFFPRAWGFRVADLDPQELRLRAEIEGARALRAHQAELFSRDPWRLSMTASLIWRLLDRRALAAAGAAEAELRRSGPSRAGYQATGPAFQAGSELEAVGRLVDVWRRGSVLLGGLARAHGMEYYHFLQPNQYLEGSKPLGPEERRVAVDPETGIAEPVALGYPMMRSAAPELAGAGVAFEDLTQVFEGVDEPLYIDSCCHVNEAGISLVVDRVVARIAAGPGAETAAGGG